MKKGVRVKERKILRKLRRERDREKAKERYEREILWEI